MQAESRSFAAFKFFSPPAAHLRWATACRPSAVWAYFDSFLAEFSFYTACGAPAVGNGLPPFSGLGLFRLFLAEFSFYTACGAIWEALCNAATN